MTDISRLFNEPENSPVFITAEIGINHNGSFERALKMIEKAKDSGADAVKFQIYKTDEFYHPKLLPEAYELFKQFELGRKVFLKLKNYAESLDMVFYATPLDMGSLDFLIENEIFPVKIASSDSATEPFLKKLSKRKVYTIVSTGFIGLKDIKRIADIFNEKNIALLYCVSKYPAEYKDFDLSFISTMRAQFKAPIGFSDHSKNIYLSIASVVLGVKLIERHFTIDNSLKGADHKISLNPVNFSNMVKAVRGVETALGQGRGEKKITEFEDRTRKLSMREIYSARNIKAGEVLSEKDVLFLRPGNGISLERINGIISQKSRKGFKKYEKI